MEWRFSLPQVAMGAGFSRRLPGHPSGEPLDCRWQALPATTTAICFAPESPQPYRSGIRSKLSRAAACQ